MRWWLSERGRVSKKGLKGREGSTWGESSCIMAVFTHQLEAERKLYLARCDPLCVVKVGCVCECAVWMANYAVEFRLCCMSQQLGIEARQTSQLCYSHLTLEKHNLCMALICTHTHACLSSTRRLSSRFWLAACLKLQMRVFAMISSNTLLYEVVTLICPCKVYIYMIRNSTLSLYLKSQWCMS